MALGERDLRRTDPGRLCWSGSSTATLISLPSDQRVGVGAVVAVESSSGGTGHPRCSLLGCVELLVMRHGARDGAATELC